MSIAGDGRVILSGQIKDEDDPRTGPGGMHMRFAAEARFRTRGGNLTEGAGTVNVNDANEVTVVLTSATDYNIDLLDFDKSVDPGARCAEILDNSDKKNYRELLNDHKTEHQSMFNRVSLDLGSGYTRSSSR